MADPEMGVSHDALSSALQWPRISNRGRFRDTRGIVKWPTLRRNGHRSVRIQRKDHLVHRLVCRAFHGKSPSTEHREVDHIDGDPSNNRAENLRWVTHAENIRHSYATNKNRKSCAPQMCKPVRGRKIKSGEDEPQEWVEYSSVNEAARKLRLNNGAVSNCCIGNKTHTQGYEFEFDTEAAVSESGSELEKEEWREINEELLEYIRGLQ